MRRPDNQLRSRFCRQGHEAAIGGAADDIEQDAAAFVGGGNIKEHQLVCPFCVIAGGGLYGIASIAQADEVNAFDDATVFNVEAGDDSFTEHD